MSEIQVPDGWDATPAGLKKVFQFQDFKASVAFVVETGRLAEAANHHPDLDIRWNKVAVTLITHDAGDQITDKDLSLAKQVDGLGADAIAGRAATLFS